MWLASGGRGPLREAKPSGRTGLDVLYDRGVVNRLARKELGLRSEAEEELLLTSAQGLKAEESLTIE